MLSPRLEENDTAVCRIVTLLHYVLFGAGDSHQRGEVWEGRGFKQQGESGLHTLSAVGGEGQRQGGHYPLVLRG